MAREKIKTVGKTKLLRPVIGTSFGEIGKRHLFVLRVYLEDRAEQLQSLAKKVKRLMENWDEIGIEQDAEDILWDICIFFSGDCTTCPMYFCEKSGLKAEKKKRESNEQLYNF
jgi:hypothetical protein